MNKGNKSKKMLLIVDYIGDGIYGICTEDGTVRANGFCSPDIALYFAKSAVKHEGHIYSGPVLSDCCQVMEKL